MSNPTLEDAAAALDDLLAECSLYGVKDLPMVDTIRAYLASQEPIDISSLDGSTSLKAYGVHHWHDEEWEFTHDIDLDCLYDSFGYTDDAEIIAIETLVKGPTLHAVMFRFEDDNDEVRFYSTEVAAKAAYKARFPDAPQTEECK